MEKVPKPISTSACRDTSVTVRKLGNSRSGRQAMLTLLLVKKKLKREKKKKERKNEETS